jgi:Mor family transcriptional regulator
MDSARQATELLSDLADIIDDECRQGGPEGLGERVAVRIAFEWGGQRLYIPFDRMRRDEYIFSKFDGANYGALARQFRMSENNVRQIVIRERERRRFAQHNFDF